MVSAASRIVRAISFGVFCRLAPSTREIMRSKKVLPASAVISTTIRSERTVVPPVTAERSPPDSRMTGADSPVMADSSTEATPSMISPSEGMWSPASQTTRSPLCNDAAGTNSSEPSARRRRAMVSERILRRADACALPRPSAIASAKLAKSTVRISQMVIDQLNLPGWAIASMSVTIEPMSTTNITGFFTWTRGSNLVTEPTSASFRIAGSKRPLASATPWGTSRGAFGVTLTMVIRRTFRG